MIERDRMSQLKAGLQSQGILVEQFADQARGVVKPMDLVACCPGGVYWAIEGKAVQIPSWTSKQSLLGPRSFREHQLPNLLKVAEQGGRASIILFVQPPRATDTRAWVLSAQGVAAMLQQDRVLRLVDFGDPAVDEFELVRLPQGRWGLGPEMLRRFQGNVMRSPYEHGWQVSSELPSSI